MRLAFHPLVASSKAHKECSSWTSVGRSKNRWVGGGRGSRDGKRMEKDGNECGVGKDRLGWVG